MAFLMVIKTMYSFYNKTMKKDKIKFGSGVWARTQVLDLTKGEDSTANNTRSLQYTLR